MQVLGEEMHLSSHRGSPVEVGRDGQQGLCCRPARELSTQRPVGEQGGGAMPPPASFPLICGPRRILREGAQVVGGSPKGSGCILSGPSLGSWVPPAWPPTCVLPSQASLTPMGLACGPRASHICFPGAPRDWDDAHLHTALGLQQPKPFLK